MAFLDNVKTVAKHPYTWIGLALAGAIGGSIYLISSSRKTPSLEGRTKEEKVYFVNFGSEDNYKKGMAVVEGLENKHKTKFSEAAKYFFIQQYMNKDNDGQVTPQEISDYVGGKDRFGKDRTWTKDLKPADVKGDGFRFMLKFDYNPAEADHLRQIIEKHSKVEGVENSEPFQIYMKDWAADKFAKDRYLNKEAIGGYDTKVQKWEKGE